MPTVNYYPPTNDGRGHWWQNIKDNGTAPLTDIGFPAPRIASIMTDAAWGVFCYITLRHYFDTVSASLTAYSNTVLDGVNGAAIPELPDFPTAPTLPAGGTCGIEGRRMKWVQDVKNEPLCTPPIEVLLGIATPQVPFDQATYVCVMLGLISHSAHTVTGKFRKAGGHVDGINFYGRPVGTTTWQPLGRFTATPFSASVPLTGTAPQEWEFMGMAVKRDEEFGLPSLISTVIVRA